ncbi:hypothetical protein [Kluyvera georgiana]|uniref:hypothetical protein n=1 Tax=Kluyvera georgiana TaxID=73098 RepID=UPI003AEFA139
MTTNLTDPKAPVTERELDQLIWGLERYGLYPRQLAALKELREVRRAKGEPVMYCSAETIACAKDGELLLRTLSSPSGDCVIPLYIVPQVPKMPDEMAISNDMNLYQKSFAQGHNACRATMLNAEKLNQPVSETERMHPNSFTDAEIEMMAHGDNPQANAYRELLAFRRNSPVAPDGWVMVPLIAFPSQWAAGQKAFESAGINKVDAVYKAMVMAAQKEVK